MRESLSRGTSVVLLLVFFSYCTTQDHKEGDTMDVCECAVCELYKKLHQQVLMGPKKELQTFTSTRPATADGSTYIEVVLNYYGKWPSRVECSAKSAASWKCAITSNLASVSLFRLHLNGQQARGTLTYTSYTENNLHCVHTRSVARLQTTSVDCQ